MTESLSQDAMITNDELQSALGEIRMGALIAVLLSLTAFLNMFRIAMSGQPDMAELYAYTLFGVLFIVAPYINIRTRLKKLESAVKTLAASV
ncbi:MAG: hypothetical protein DHS20C12_08200 [Pseudohongiella sp.]|nr:MAG: hypothetical protein DHS20C12_08200 [Pseudohongiella sp.]